MAKRNYMSHVGFDQSTFVDRINREQFSWTRAGENVAAGYRDVASVMKRWLNSPGTLSQLTLYLSSKSLFTPLSKVTEEIFLDHTSSLGEVTRTTCHPLLDTIGAKYLLTRVKKRVGKHGTGPARDSHSG
jgi:hypothetical protein